MSRFADDASITADNEAELSEVYAVAERPDLLADSFEWAKLPPVPPVTSPVAPPETSLPSLPTMHISTEPISAEQFEENYRMYWEQVLKIPGWQELLAEKSRALSEARKVARRKARNGNHSHSPAIRH